MCFFPASVFAPGANMDNTTVVDADYMDARDDEIKAIENSLGLNLVPGTGGSPSHSLDEVVRVTSSGDLYLAAESGSKVGIGTSTPSEILDVVGNLKVSGALIQGEAALQSFSVEIKNDGGTLKHRTSVGAFTANSANCDDKVSGASNAYNTTPSVDDSTGFTAGIGIEAALPANIIMNTADQSGIPDIRFTTIVFFNSSGTAVLASPGNRNIDVDGTTQHWASSDSLISPRWCWSGLPKVWLLRDRRGWCVSSSRSGRMQSEVNDVRLSLTCGDFRRCACARRVRGHGLRAGGALVHDIV